MGSLLRRGLVVGYATVALLTLLPFAVLSGISAPVVDVGTPPFAVFAIALAVVLVVLRPLWLVVRLHPEPTRQLLEDFRLYSPWVLTSGFALLAIAQTIEGALSLKQAIPYINPFWADPALIRLDRLLFFGHDAWQVTHALVPATGTRVIDGLYAVWHPVQIGFCMAIVLLFDRRLQLQAVLSFQLAWLLVGNLLAISLASVGPIFVADFWGRNDFLPMVAQLQNEGAVRTVFSSAYLLESHGTNAFGGGISAMPSMHVAIVVLVALFLRKRLPVLQWFAWAFAAVTYLGSIHLGYHYATDGIVSAFFVVLIWKTTGLYVSWLTSLAPDWPEHEHAPGVAEAPPAK